MRAQVALDPLPLLLHDHFRPMHEVADGDVLLHGSLHRLAEAVMEAGEMERGLAQRLGGDGAGVHARAADDRLALDQRDALAKVRRLRRALLTGGTGADDDEVIHGSSGMLAPRVGWSCGLRVTSCGGTARFELRVRHSRRSARGTRNP
jgi:hypothetical protein